MIYPNDFERKIGFDVVRAMLKQRCVGTLGEEQVVALHPTLLLAEMQCWLEQTAELQGLLERGIDIPLEPYAPLRDTMQAVMARGTWLSAAQLYELRRLLQVVQHLADFFAKGAGADCSRLKALAEGLHPMPEVVDAIDRVLDVSGNIRDDASPQLLDLRKRKARLTALVGRLMTDVIARAKQDGVLASDVQPSVRDGRLVVPVPAASKRRIRGIVHDASASGHTVYIEPESIVENDNQMREIDGEVEREQVRILTEVTNQVRPYIEDLYDMMQILGQFDLTRAKARLAQELGAQMPHIDAEPIIEWYGAFHPVLWITLKQQAKQLIPLDITLNQQHRIVVISGPNAGGKSVCLKTVGIVQYMAQCGVMPTIRDHSHIGIFRNLLVDIGDQQSIEDDLSTYSSHLQNMKLMLNRGSSDTLVLIDEMGSGTEPQIGGAIAQAILEQLNQMGVMGVVTTHYHNLKHLAEQTDGLINGAMLYDRQQMKPLFQLAMGYPGSSFAMEIARKIGLPSSVIDEASEIVGSDYINMDKYLLDIARDRRYWSNKRHEIRVKEKRLEQTIADMQQRVDAIKSEQRQIIKEAHYQAQEILKQSNATIERTIREIRQNQAEKEKTKRLRQQLEQFKQRLQNNQDRTAEQLPANLKRLVPKRYARKNQSSAQDVAQSPRQQATLTPGAHVILKGSNNVGVVMSVEQKQALVAFGNIKTRVPIDQLQPTNRQLDKPQSSSDTRTSSDEIRVRQLHFKPDIDVRGMRADEAVQAITYFIDDAIQFNASRVRILHGTGTGALRQAIRQYLASVRGVKAYHDEHVQLGGAGITVVDLDS